MNSIDPQFKADWAAAQRCSDLVNQAVTDGFAGTWLAVRLSDGGSDNVHYTSKAGAVAHQLHETQCAYIRVPPDGMPLDHAYGFLKINRKLYDAGARLSDPDKDVLLNEENLERLSRELKETLTEMKVRKELHR